MTGFVVVAAVTGAITGVPRAQAEPVSTPHVEAELVSEAKSIRPGESFWLGLRLVMDDDWHVYWVNPGDSGLPTKIEWRLPEGFEARDIQWPHPERIEASSFVSYGYEHEVTLLAEIDAPSDLAPGTDVSLAAHASWTVCRDDRCIPSGADLTLTLPVAEGPPSLDRYASTYFETTRSRLPRAIESWKLSAAADDGAVVITLVPVGPDTHAEPGAVTVFEKQRRSLIDHAEPATVHRDGERIHLRLKAKKHKGEPPARIEGVLVAKNGWDAAGTVHAMPFAVEVERGRLPDLDAAMRVAPSAPDTAAGTGSEAAAETGPSTASGGRDTATRGDAPASRPTTSRTAHGIGLALSLLFAALGGLILNLMPCVFPVLSLKVVGFVESAGGDPRHGRMHALAFAAGVIVFFWLLAALLLGLRASGEQLGWGFQLQSPTFVAALAMLVFGLGLNMAGVFELGTSIASITGRAEQPTGYLGSFASGALATVLATPCTAPFMGSALGYALGRPALDAMLVFTALGVGMASPYVVLASVPSLLRRLPRPGAWMETFKQAMSFPLFATTVWLVWVFGRQVGNDGVARLLGALLLVGLAGWVVGRFGGIAAPEPKRRRASLTSFALMIAALALAVNAAGVERRTELALASAAADTASGEGTEALWLRYDPDELARLRAAGKPVFIDFTAAWCLTCQVNERVAFTSKVHERFRDLGVVTMKADWTSRDPAITNALAELGRDGVPLYVLYHGDGAEPVILPQILSPGIVLDALEQIARG